MPTRISADGRTLRIHRALVRGSGIAREMLPYGREGTVAAKIPLRPLLDRRRRFGYTSFDEGGS